MNDQNLLSIVAKAGLDELEGKVYLALLKLGSATYKQVSLESKINRSSCYPVSERLKNRGIVSIIKKGAKKIITPVRPEKLLEIQKENYEFLQSHLEKLNSVADFVKKDPSTQYYEGTEGLKTVLSMLIKEAKEVRIFGDGDAFKNSIPGWTENYSLKRLQNNIKAKIILKGTSTAILSAKKVKSPLNKIRVLPEAYNITGGFDVYSDKAILYSFNDRPTAVVIENQIISNLLKTVFDILWNEAEKYDRTLLRN